MIGGGRYNQSRISLASRHLPGRWGRRRCWADRSQQRLFFCL